MLLLIDQHTGSVTYIETIHDDSFFFKTAYAKLDVLKNGILGEKSEGLGVKNDGLSKNIADLAGSRKV